MINSSHNSAIAGAFSGLIGRAIVQPLDVIKIRFQLQVEPLKCNQGKYVGIIQAGKCIYTEEGIRALWKGHMTGQIHAVSFSVVQFWLFNILKTKTAQLSSELTGSGRREMLDFAAGSMSGLGAIASTHPLDIVRTRLAAQGEPRLYRGMLHAGSSIVTREGFRGLYKGLLPNCLLISPQTGLQFLFYGICNRTIDRTRRFITGNPIIDPSSGGTISKFLQNGLSGGLAGIVAKTAVYPLDLVKKRMQVQGFEEARVKFGRLHSSRGFVRCVQVVLAEEGPGGFIKGIRPSLLKSFLSIGLKFSVYELVLRALLSRSATELINFPL